MSNDQEIKELLTKYQIIKNKEYYKGFSDYISSQKNDVFWKFFNDKQHRISERLLSYRVISHWEKEGILGFSRTNEGSWRKYSLMDIVWISIVKYLRHFGVGLPEIKSMRLSLISTMNQCEYGELEFCTALAYVRRVPVHVLAFHNRTMEVGTAYAIIDSEEKYGLYNHISINLNATLQTIFPDQNLKPIYDEFIEIKGDLRDEIVAIQQLPNEGVRLSMRDGKDTYIPHIVNEPTNSKVGQLITKDSNQNITVEVRDSKIISVKRQVFRKTKATIN